MFSHDGEIAHGKEDQHRSQENTFIETGTDGQAHTGGGPEARRGGKALDLPPAGDKDRTGAQKADAVMTCAPKRETSVRSPISDAIDAHLVVTMMYSY